MDLYVYSLVFRILDYVAKYKKIEYIACRDQKYVCKYIQKGKDPMDPDKARPPQKVCLQVYKNVWIWSESTVWNLVCIQCLEV